MQGKFSSFALGIDPASSADRDPLDEIKPALARLNPADIALLTPKRFRQLPLRLS